MNRVYTLRSIAQDLNLNKRSVEHAYERAKKNSESLGEIIDGTRYFDDDERLLILNQISKTQKRVEPKTLDNALVLTESQIVSNVQTVDPLAINLEALENKVAQLVTFGKNQIQLKDEENRNNTIATIEAEKRIAKQLQELRLAQETAKTKQAVYEVMQQSSAVNAKNLLSELQGLIS